MAKKTTKKQAQKKKTTKTKTTTKNKPTKKKATQKTLPTTKSVPAFLKGVAAPRRADSEAVMQMMQELTGEPPVLWGPSIIGFGSQHYKYASGREGDWPRAALSPRKPALVVYLMGGKRRAELLEKLGRHEMTGSCLYIKTLDGVDRSVLRALIEDALTNPPA